MSVSGAGSFYDRMASVNVMLALFTVSGCAFGHIFTQPIKNPRQQSYRGLGY